MNKPMGLRQGVSYGRRNIPAGAQPWETIVRLTLVAGLTLCWWGKVLEPVLAQVPRIQGQGTAASGMGNAFSAQADDPSALHYNPAGMTQLHGVEFMTGVLLSGGTTNFTSPTGVTATGDRNGSVAWPPPGHLYITANLKDLGVTALGDLTAGIGLTVPFGSLTRWPNDGPFRTATTFNTLPLLDIKPTLAYKLTDDLSIGLGADIYTFSGLFGEGHVERKSVWPGGGGIPAGSQVELFGRDTAAGFNASLLYTASTKCGWQAAGQHRNRLPQSGHAAPERSVTGKWRQGIRCHGDVRLASSHHRCHCHLAGAARASGNGNWKWMWIMSAGNPCGISTSTWPTGGPSLSR